MVLLNARRLAFLKAHELCRFATVSEDGKPHVVPVIYAMDGGKVVVAIDYGTKKLKNLRKNPNVALVVDEYHPNHAVMIEGRCEVFERGREYRRLLRLLFDRFEFYRRDPWGEGECPIISVTPEKAFAW